MVETSNTTFPITSPSLFPSEAKILTSRIESNPRYAHLLSLPIPAVKPTPEHMRIIASNYSTLFDTLFFHSTLTPHIRIEVKPLTIEGCYTHTTRTISLSSNLSWERAKNGHAGSELLSTLLHEMMHAFFNFWGDASLMRVPACENGIGRGGHGRAWADAMVIVEMGWNLLFLDGRVGCMVNCAVFDSVAISMFQEGWRAGVDEMRRWGADEKLVPRWAPGGEWGDPSVTPESMRKNFSWVVEAEKLQIPAGSVRNRKLLS